MDFRRPMRWIRARALDLAGFGRHARGLLDGSRALVLMYHRVVPGKIARRESIEPGMFVTAATFARHLSWLEAHFRVLPLREIIDRVEARRPLPPGACAITFDDGWRDNLEHAWPELAHRGLPATIFVVTDRVGTDGAFWTDELWTRMRLLPDRESEEIARRFVGGRSNDAIKGLLDHLKSAPEERREYVLQLLREIAPQPAVPRRVLLDWDELERLSASGIDIEAHGATHAILRGLERERVESELRSSLTTLRDRGYARHRLLAYPNGDHDALVRGIGRAVGFRAAVTTTPGLLDLDKDLMAIPRIGLHEDVSRNRAEFMFRLPRHA